MIAGTREWTDYRVSADVTPPREYLDMYRQLGVPQPFIGGWAKHFESWPYALRVRYHHLHGMSPQEVTLAHMGFYAQCSCIDHQMRLLIGTLREEGLLDDTIIMFASDHGDMLGNHGLWAKPPMYEWSAKIPLILVPTAGDYRLGHHRTDDRLACLRDVMPTLLDLCGIPIPDSVEGQSLASDERRDHLYCEHFENDQATRMVRADQYKLIWYPVGNRVQLFDLNKDPREMHDLSQDPQLVEVRERLTRLLVSNCYGSDLKWVENGQLTGVPEKDFRPSSDRGLWGQWGWR